jgi:hypothetical protein
VSLSTDLELQKKKAELRSLQKREYLEASSKISAEKSVIPELEEKIEVKREVLRQLKSRKRELKKRLILNHIRKSKWF